MDSPSVSHERVIELSRSGLSYSEIGALMKVSRQRVQQILAKHGIYRPRAPKNPRNAPRNLRIEPDKQWYLYIMDAPSGDGWRYRKVGRSTNLLSRLRSVQVGCPIPITIIRAIKVKDSQSSCALEKVMHSRFYEYRTVGEWFRFKKGDDGHDSDVRSAMDYVRQHDESVSEWVKFTSAELVAVASESQAASVPIRGASDLPIPPEDWAHISGMIERSHAIDSRESV